MTRGGPNRGQGRKAEHGTPRSERFPMIMTEAEKAELTAAAAEHGQSLNDYLIQSGLERARSAGKRLRVIDALHLPEVLAGEKWIALPLPGGVVLPSQTVGVSPRGRLHWCDRVYDPRVMIPSHLGTEAMLTLPQLLGGCTLIDAKHNNCTACGGPIDENGECRCD